MSIVFPYVKICFGEILNPKSYFVGKECVDVGQDLNYKPWQTFCRDKMISWKKSFVASGKCSTNRSMWCFLCVPSIPLCTLINQHLSLLARKFPQTKFLKSISTTCIPNYPDRNLPTIFVYFEGEMKAQFIGPLVFGGMNLKVEGRRGKKERQDFEHTLKSSGPSGWIK